MAFGWLTAGNDDKKAVRSGAVLAGHTTSLTANQRATGPKGTAHLTHILLALQLHHTQLKAALTLRHWTNTVLTCAGFYKGCFCSGKRGFKQQQGWFTGLASCTWGEDWDSCHLNLLFTDLSLLMGFLIILLSQPQRLGYCPPAGWRWQGYHQGYTLGCPICKAQSLASYLGSSPTIRAHDLTNWTVSPAVRCYSKTFGFGLVTFFSLFLFHTSTNSPLAPCWLPEISGRGSPSTDSLSMWNTL